MYFSKIGNGSTLEYVKFSTKKAFKNFQQICDIMYVNGPCLQIITLFFLIRGLIKVYVHMNVKEKGIILEE